MVVPPGNRHDIREPWHLAYSETRIDVKTRLLRVIWQGGIGGLERGVVDFTRHVDLMKYDVTVAILSRGGITTDQIDRGTIRLVEFGFSNCLDIPAFLRFLRFLRSNPFDIVHSHVRTILMNVALLIPKPRPILVYHEHGMTLLRDSIGDRLFYAAFARYYNAFIAIHKEMVQFMKRASRVCAERTVIIENPVDTELFKPSDEAKRKFEATTTRKSPTIGTVARLIPEKDLDLFLQTAQVILRKRPDTQFVIVGTGPLWARLKATSEGPDFKGRVALVGESSDVPNILRSFDVFLFTSRIEPFGRTLIESLACGVPVVGAKPELGGARSLLETLSGVSLVSERSPEALANAVLSLLGNPELMERLGRAGREHVVKHYAVENWGKALDALYQGLLRNKHGE
jgi:glycosyltransferase involved in cell wall biosynthesis